MSTVRTAVVDLARRRRRRSRIRVVSTLTGLVAVTAAVWAVWASPLFAVRSITVEGTSRLSTAQVRAAAGVRLGTPLARVDPGTVARRVDSLRAVASTHVVRRWPHGLVIDVRERRPVAVLEPTAGPAELLDRTGFAFSDVVVPPRGLVPVRVRSGGLAAARAGVEVFMSWSPGLRRRVVAVTAAGPDDIVVTLPRGRTVVWGSAADGARKLAVLQLLLRHQPHVTTYDVSSPGVAVTR
jgi:cell division protein FtsQ